AQSHEHRDAARLSLGRVPSGPTFARTSEWLFELLSPLGVPDKVIGLTADAAALYVGAFAFEESLGLASPTGEAMPREEIVELFTGYLRSLPEDRFPHLRRAAAALFSGDADERFEFGLDLLLRGLGTYTCEPAPERGPSG
ncbi:MAG: TetR/AcrR family transcriptional regulator C-terminal domain-containing protein, partial [Candidatus Dormibacteraceae bacterium]